MSKDNIESAYKLAQEQYAEYGVDTIDAVNRLREVVLSLQCWQADDVTGFEPRGKDITGGGIQVTGSYPGKARNLEEVRLDLEKVMLLLPGKQKISLHAMYGEFNGKVTGRDEIEPVHFRGWCDWALEMKTGLDFNATLFAHPMAGTGFTLSSKNSGIRKYWVEHVKRCREISAEIGRKTGMSCVHNTWIPDGSKDHPVDRFRHRELLKMSLDEIFDEKFPFQLIKDSLESKLFGIGSESMVVGSYDFYLAYAVKNNKLLCLDNGHFHPTEQAGDKISSLLLYLDEILLHLTRGVRWDSDHVVIFNDEIKLIAQEIVRCNALKRVNFGLDFFDASINRIGAYVTGARSVMKALLFALLEPVALLKKYEEEGKLFERLFLLEKMNSMPWGAVWDYYCEIDNVVSDGGVIAEINDYERTVLAGR